MDFKLTITASPELLNAINALATALGGVKANTQVSAPTQQVQERAQAVNQINQQNGQMQPQVQPAYAPTNTSTVPPVVQSQQQPPVVNQVQPTQNIKPTVPPVVPPVQQTPGVVPTTTQTYSMEQLAVAATQLVDAGRRNDLVNLLASFGVQALTMLPKEQYGAFATQLRAMGAKI